MTIHDRRVLVTGAGGFIGSHLTERLVRDGARVRAMVHYDSRPDRSNLEFLPPAVLESLEIVAGDVADPHFMLDAVKDCDVVFHLAALIAIPYSYLAPAAYVQTNVMGTLNVAQACLAHGVARLLHTSTSECYGTARYAPIDEQHPLQGQSPYSASKIGADKIVESYHLSFGLPAVTIRPFNTFGPRQSARAVIPTIVSQLVHGATELHLGSLEPLRDFNFVTNTVDGFVAAATADSDACVGEVINLGSGEEVSIGETARLAMEVVGREVPIRTDDARVRPERSEVGRLLCNWQKANDRLGWSPRVGLREGLGEVVAFVERHPERFRPREYAR